MNGFRLSVLDFGERQIGEGGVPVPADAALREVVQRAVAAERFGYARYWLAQHFVRTGCWAHPEPVIATIAARTDRISVGAAGLLINHLDATRIASDYSLLSALAPGRIDLGLSQGAPEARSLRQAQPCEPRRELARRARGVDELLAPDGGDPVVFPHPPNRPSIWVLGMSDELIRLAAERRFHICASAFHGKPNLEAFAATLPLRGVVTRAIAVSGCCAETTAAAERARHSYHGPMTVNLVGDPGTIMAAMRRLVERFGIDEIVFLELSPDPKARLRSMALLAAAAAV
jgi:alkanesulfonate monooxygenase SsuD/methylene tetrahydromethanopterin reductase-like flavin-dependent oxidoreductase (luciferase family)